MKKAPVLISVPHGGAKTPKELLPYTNMNEEDRYLDGDAHTTEIYNFSESVLETHMASVARCYIDLNRKADDLPPNNHDGVLKTVNLYGKPIYKDQWFPDKELIAILLKKYYHPYHNALLQAEKRGIELAIDCHSMLPYAPDFGEENDLFEHRPEICLGNLGDENGDPLEGKKTSCSKELLDEFTKGLQKSFFNEDIRVSMNHPFKGGYITQFHGTSSALPWIQLEINRSLYMEKNYCNPLSNRTKESRINDLNQKIKDAVLYLFS